jgi:hypothetical protein
MAMAREYLDVLTPSDVAGDSEPDEAELSEPSAQAQGPPH